MVIARIYSYINILLIHNREDIDVTLPYKKIIDYSFDKRIDNDKIKLVTKDLPVFINYDQPG